VSPPVAWHVVKRLPLPLLAASAVGWMLLAGGDAGPSLSALCFSTASPSEAIASRLGAALTVASPVALAFAWSAMLAAMMPPLLAAQLRHVLARTLTRRRIRAVMLFLLGYLLMWLMAGAVLTLASLLLGSVAIAAAVPPSAAAALIAVFWQATPLKQSSLNRCHGKPPLAAFGLRAEADAFGYGAAHGAWCIGSCWALMLLPLAAGPSLHLPVMAMVMTPLIVERARVPTLVRWGAALPRLPRSSRALFTGLARRSPNEFTPLE
jgi:predicted metal-binding membrane protein